MTEKSRHLIISSDVSTWKFSEPVLFLGKWCLREQDKEIWRNMDAAIAAPIGAEYGERNLLYLEARRIEALMFPRLIRILNDYHAIERDQRYWKIMVGHWLRQVIQLLLNRIITIENCLENYQISSVTLYNKTKIELAANEYSDIWTQANDYYWNACIFELIINLLQKSTLIIERKEYNFEGNSNLSKLNSKSKIMNSEQGDTRLTPRQLIDKSSRKLAKLFERENNAFVINSYLPPEKEIRLNMALCQFPQRRISPGFEVTTEVDHEIRALLGQQMKLSSDSKIEGIVASLLLSLIPVNYIEGYKHLIDASQRVRWPKKPKFIFTSNSFVGDELFKAWVAEKVITGTPYLVGQHGNVYGTHKFYHSTIEETTADRFLTWGWGKGIMQYAPAFVFKNSLNEKYRNTTGTKLLLIEDNPMARFEVWDQSDQYSKYMEDQFIFALSLETRPRENLMVRLHPAYRAMLGEGDIRWKNFDSNVLLELGVEPIRKLWQTSRLIVHSYDSTGLLETLEANIPTIAFWQNGLEHLVDEAIPFYKFLINAGIVHLTPESAASKINEIWEDVDSWWSSPEVQSAREIFCGEYARTSQKPIRDLRKLLLETKGMLA